MVLLALSQALKFMRSGACVSPSYRAYNTYWSTTMSPENILADGGARGHGREAIELSLTASILVANITNLILTEGLAHEDVSLTICYHYSQLPMPHITQRGRGGGLDP